MTAKQFAELLDKREYCEELTAKEEQLAKEHGLVVVFGGSDDLCELRGAIHGEHDCYNGGRIRFKNGYKAFDAQWCHVKGWAWTYSVAFTHHIFRIMEGSDGYCQGFVFKLEDAKK